MSVEQMTTAECDYDTGKHFERERLTNALLGKIYMHTQAIKLWEKTTAPNKQQIMHDLDMERSGMLFYACGSLFSLGTSREEILDLAIKYGENR